MDNFTFVLFSQLPLLLSLSLSLSFFLSSFVFLRDGCGGRNKMIGDTTDGTYSHSSLSGSTLAPLLIDHAQYLVCRDGGRLTPLGRDDLIPAFRAKISHMEHQIATWRDEYFSVAGTLHHIGTFLLQHDGKEEGGNRRSDLLCQALPKNAGSGHPKMKACS